MAIHLDNNTFLKTKNVYSYFQATVDTSKNMIFKRNNWLEVSPFSNNQLCFNNLNSKNIAVWLSSRGEFCYRTSLWSVIHTIHFRNADIVLSNLLGYEIQIKKSKLLKVSNMSLPIKIYISELLLVDEEIFVPLQPAEFFNLIPNNLNYYRNTFMPSIYLQLLFQDYHEYNYSITVQYIYYLSNYQQDRFNFIMHWLAAFFKNLCYKSKTTLVFLGNKESGKEILFDEIIKPLFGQEYCLKITDTLLETISIQDFIKDKLFYNLDNISNSHIKVQRTRKTLYDLLSKDTIEVIEKKKSIEEYPKYGQTLITIDEAYLPSYIDKNFEDYSLFKIPDESTLLDAFNLKQKSSGIHMEEDRATDSQIFEDYLLTLNLTSKAKIVKAIRGDLTNFAYILKGYPIKEENLHTQFENDDKKYLQNTLEDKLQAFHEAILKYKTSTNYFQKIQEKNPSLYKELMDNFKEDKIKQKNLIKIFSIIYSEENITSSKTLMIYLREIDSFLYSSKNFKLGTAGVKFFKLK